MIATAYRFIRYDKVKSIGVIIGIVVSIFLIGQDDADFRLKVPRSYRFYDIAEIFTST